MGPKSITSNSLSELKNKLLQSGSGFWSGLPFERSGCLSGLLTLFAMEKLSILCRQIVVIIFLSSVFGTTPPSSHGDLL